MTAQDLDFQIINYRKVALAGDWFIALSVWDNKTPRMSSASCGKWHKNKRGKVILGGAKKRVPYHQSNEADKAKAMEKLIAYINNPPLAISGEAR